MRLKDFQALEATVKGWSQAALLAQLDHHDPLVAALVARALVLGNAPRTYAVGKRWLDQAEPVFAALARDNRLLTNAWRNFLIVKGRHLARYFRSTEAIAAYQQAILGETNPDRRALGQLNIARVHFAEGRYFLAYRQLRRIAPDKLREPSLRAGLLLAKVRIMVSMGRDGEAADLLKGFRGSALRSPRDRIELRYLSLLARGRFGGRAAFLRRIDDFERSLAEQQDNRVEAFYLTEIAILRRILSQRFPRKQAYLIRLRYLATKGQANDLYRIAAMIEGLFESRAAFARRWDPFFERFAALAGRSHHLFCQNVAVFLIEVLLYKNHVDAARDLAAFLEGQVGDGGSLRQRLDELGPRLAREDDIESWLAQSNLP